MSATSTDKSVKTVMNVLSSLQVSGMISDKDAKIIAERLEGAKAETTAEPGEWLTVKQVSTNFKTCPATVRRMCKAGRLKHRYLSKGSPKTLRIHSSELEAGA
ncbi:helix-turn-helix domain-containing protein [Kiritimatiellota bacterium B12222]|nr:helix-turn-helix domain-containing protein [Kiritimatiellota bacterium B12222]